MIEVYADIWCPFTHAGLQRLVARRNEVGSQRRLRVRPWPLEIVNGSPMDAASTGEKAADLRAQVAPNSFAGLNAHTFPSTTLPALALVEAAYAVSDEVGEAMSLELREALFERGIDISKPEVLAGIAEALSVPQPGEAEAAAVLESLELGKQRGVVGSPHFFTDDGNYFCPALNISREDGHLKISADIEAFQQFIEAAFG